jgi:hypothetical protein
MKETNKLKKVQTVSTISPTVEVPTNQQQQDVERSVSAFDEEEQQEDDCACDYAKGQSKNDPRKDI